MENKENNLQTKETVRKLQEVVKDCLSNKEIKNELFPDGKPDFEEFIMTMASLDLDRYSLKHIKQKRAKRIMNAILFFNMGKRA